MPTGGVSRPIIRFSTMMMPKWTGSTPTFTATGSSTGVRMVMAAMRLHEAADDQQEQVDQDQDHDRIAA